MAHYVVTQELLQALVNFLVEHPENEKTKGIAPRMRFVDAIGKLPTLAQFEAERKRKKEEAAKAEKEMADIRDKAKRFDEMASTIADAVTVAEEA